MLCPRCHVELKRKKVRERSTEVDLCSQCQGVWFDDGEIKEVIGSRAVHPLPIPQGAVKAAEQLCPRCRVPLVVFTYPGTMTVIDACRACRGVFLDSLELEEIHAARGEAGMTCPKCGQIQSRASSCVRCGIVVEKFLEAQAQRGEAGALPAIPVKGPSGEKLEPESAGLKGALLTFVDGAISTMWEMITRRD
jgi:Zn-finger nucleic acid-binding protein